MRDFARLFYIRNKLEGSKNLKQAMQLKEIQEKGVEEKATAKNVILLVRLFTLCTLCLVQ